MTVSSQNCEKEMSIVTCGEKLMNRLFKNETFSDLTVFIPHSCVFDNNSSEDGISFPVVRALLGNVSDPFRAMLFGDFYEGSNNTDNNSNKKDSTGACITIDSITPNAFEVILRFAYSLDFEVTPDTVKEVLDATMLFQIEDLAQLVFEKVVDTMTVHTVLKFFSNILGFKIPCLIEERIWRFIVQNSAAFHLGFSDCDERILLRLVHCDFFHMNEEYFWMSLEDWCENTGESMSMFLNHIRYPIMDKEMFVDSVCPSLPPEIFANVYGHEILARPSRFKVIPRRKFNPFAEVVYADYAILNASSSQLKIGQDISDLNVWSLGWSNHWIMISFQLPVSVVSLEWRQKEKFGTIEKILFEAMDDFADQCLQTSEVQASCSSTARNFSISLDELDNCFAQIWKISLIRTENPQSSLTIPALSFKVQTCEDTVDDLLFFDDDGNFSSDCSSGDEEEDEETPS
jgi:hypothetical protein